MGCQAFYPLLDLQRDIEILAFIERKISWLVKEPEISYNSINVQSVFAGRKPGKQEYDT